MADPEVESIVNELVAKHQSVSDDLEDKHLDSAIDEAQTTGANDRRILSPFLPAKAEDVAAFISLLGVGRNDLLIDLGCGDGRVLVAAARTKGCCGLGIDISEDCLAAARSMSAAEGTERQVTFERIDLLDPGALNSLAEGARRLIDQDTEAKTRVEGRVVVFLYVYPTLLRRLPGLVRGLAQALRPEKTRVVTLVYHFTPAEWPAADMLLGGRLQVYSLLGVDRATSSEDDGPERATKG